MANSKEIVLVAENRLQQLTAESKIDIAPNFSATNAIREAQLILEADPKLMACDPLSIQHSILKMIVLGLSPMKQQIYFIPRGKKLCADISYFGSMALVKRFCKAIEIVNMVIYQDDEFDYEIKGGKYQIPRHKTSFKNRAPDKIIGAYCIIYFSNTFYVDIMTMDEIKKSWSMSKYYESDSVHSKFTEEMCKRTVCNRACKPWLRASADYEKTQHQQIETGLKTEIDHYANQIEIDIPDGQEEDLQPDPETPSSEPEQKPIDKEEPVHEPEPEPIQEPEPKAEPENNDEKVKRLKEELAELTKEKESAPAQPEQTQPERQAAQPANMPDF